MDQKTILEAITEGFIKISENAVFNISMIAGLLIMLFVVSVFFNIMMKRNQYKKWQTEYEKSLRVHDLTINEIDLLDKLAPYLIDSRRKILLLTNRNTLLIALHMWKTKTGQTSGYSRRLVSKIFPGEAVLEHDEGSGTFGQGCPVRFVSGDGKAFTGILEKKTGDKLVMNQVHAMKSMEKSGMNYVHIQDYRGIRSYRVTATKKTGPNALELTIQKALPTKKDKISISDVDLYIYGTEETVKTSLVHLGRGFGIVDNPEEILKKGQLLQMTFQGDMNHLYRINATVSGVSSGKQFARLKFGYLKPSDKQ